jgi:hypothetical protein
MFDSLLRVLYRIKNSALCETLSIRPSIRPSVLWKQCLILWNSLEQFCTKAIDQCENRRVLLSVTRPDINFRAYRMPSISSHIQWTIWVRTMAWESQLNSVRNFVVRLVTVQWEAFFIKDVKRTFFYIFIFWQIWTKFGFSVIPPTSLECCINWCSLHRTLLEIWYLLLTAVGLT